MPQLGNCAGFLQETFAQSRVGRDIRIDDLDGDVAIEGQVATEIDRAHSAHAHPSADLIVRAYGKSEGVDRAVRRDFRYGHRAVLVRAAAGRQGDH